MFRERQNQNSEKTHTPTMLNSTPHSTVGVVGHLVENLKGATDSATWALRQCMSTSTLRMTKEKQDWTNAGTTSEFPSFLFSGFALNICRMRSLVACEF